MEWREALFFGGSSALRQSFRYSSLSGNPPDKGSGMLGLRMLPLLPPDDERGHQRDNHQSHQWDQPHQVAHGFSSFCSRSSGISKVPTEMSTTVIARALRVIRTLSRPVTSWPIRMIEITNSALHPNIAARYFRFALLSFTFQEYHAPRGVQHPSPRSSLPTLKLRRASPRGRWGFGS